MFTLNCKGKLISTDHALVMGIINATPDSFYKGDLNSGIAGISALVKKMIVDGADIIDVGGQSSRPGSKAISEDEERSRLIPVIEMIAESFPGTVISADTYRSNIAKAAVEAGASMINDISGGEADKEMIATVAGLQVPYICMHMKGSPENMDRHAVYGNVTEEVLNYFILKSEACKKAGIIDLIIDPGFGFAKTATHNFQLLRDLHLFKIIGRPLLAGLSRKSTISKTLGVSAADALNGTTVLNTLALNNGAGILRVHDVKEAKEAVLLVEQYKKSCSP
ncbi:MAG: dihydropteroate synthase [Ferruginibacter sp.]